MQTRICHACTRSLTPQPSLLGRRAVDACWRGATLFLDIVRLEQEWRGNPADAEKFTFWGYRHGQPAPCCFFGRLFLFKGLAGRLQWGRCGLLLSRAIAEDDTRPAKFALPALPHTAWDGACFSRGTASCSCNTLFSQYAGLRQPALGSRLLMPPRNLAFWSGHGWAACGYSWERRWTAMTQPPAWACVPLSRPD
jgi:hypothetical protein